MSLDQSHYDVALFGTGLTQSILSAALSSAGLSVIHIDQNDYYADQWASLTLSELLKWAANASTTSEPEQEQNRRVSDVSLAFPASADNEAPQSSISSQLPQSLVSLDRHYAISLAPTLLSATGPSIDCLISSKVSSYATFRLLERTCVASSSAHGPHGSAMTLMSVPASKEDIFKTKTLSLIAKRKLMKLLMYIATEDWQSELAQDPETAKRPFADYLAQVHKMPSDLIDAVAYGVCLCSTPRETTETAMSRAKSHMASVGRYGNSAYLVGQYGGAGELAQGYCRASAVKGGMFILAHQVRSANYDKQAAKWSIEVEDVDSTITSDYLVSSDDMLTQLGLDSSAAAASNAADPSRKLDVLHRAVLVLEKPLRFSTAHIPETKAADSTQQDADQPQEQAQPELPPETGLVVFPPGSIGGNANTVTVLMMGEGTFSCPKGQYVYYVQTEASEAEAQRPVLEVLQPVLDQIVAWTSYDEASDDASQRRAKPLVELTYRQHVSSHAGEHDGPGLSRIAFPPPQAEGSPTPRPTASIAGLTDAAVHQAEEVYYNILASRLPAGVGGEGHDDKVNWIKKAVEEQKAERKRRRGREPSEYQGRGGRGADDGITAAGQEAETEALPVQEDTYVVEFFGSSSNRDDDDQDEADEGQ